MKEVVQVPTRELAEEVLRVAKENGIYTRLSIGNWDKYKEDTCWSNESTGEYSDIEWYKGNGYKIITAEEFLSRYKPKFRPIAMRCTQEHFDAVRGKLVGCEIVFVNSLNKSPYLVNNLGGKENHVSNSTSSFKTRYDREVFEEWNEKTFLEYCGIEVKDEVNELDKLRKENEELRSINDTLNKENLEHHNELTLLKEKLKAIEDQPKAGDVCLFWDGLSKYYSLEILSEIIKGKECMYITHNKDEYANCIKATDENIKAKIKELQDAI